MACSTPPIYWSTGIHRATASCSKGNVRFFGSVKRRKYQEESTNVSIVSVSRTAGSWQTGQVVLVNASFSRKGDPPVPVKVTSRGRMTGRSLSGTGTVPQRSQ